MPVVEKRRMFFRRFDGEACLEPGVFGTSHPHAGQPVVDPDFIVAPLAAFDRRGGRIGYGAGHYDRAIADLIARNRAFALAGIAFAAQEVEQVPLEPHDVRLPLIATERELIEVGCRRPPTGADRVRLLFLGDVVGRSGRKAVTTLLPGLIEKHRFDFVVVNGENAAGGFGITEEILQDLLAAGRRLRDDRQSRVGPARGAHLRRSPRPLPAARSTFRRARPGAAPTSTPRGTARACWW